MSGNVKFRFLLAPIVVALLVVASPASAKDHQIVDVYFDDGSILHNVEFIPRAKHEKVIEVMYENEIFKLSFDDLQTIEFEVKLGTPQTINLKIKTKTGVVINDRFSLAKNRLFSALRGNNYCRRQGLSFANKLTGKKVTKYYDITKLRIYSRECWGRQDGVKGITAIVFKDDIEEKTEGEHSPSEWLYRDFYSGPSKKSFFGEKTVTGDSLADYSQSPPTQSKPTIPLALAKDITPPSIEIASSITVKEDTPIIKGRVSDDSEVVQVTVEGRQTDLKKNGVFSFKRYVPSGESSIRIVAIDEWGNKSQKDVRIKRIVTAKIPTPKKPQSGTGSGLSSEEELAKKMTNYYKNASDQEIDKFIIGLTNAKKKVLPQKLNKAVTLYKVEYIKDGNVVGYAYEVNADNLGLTEKELVAGKQNLTYSLREHHKRYFCTSPTIRMELDIGIDFFINIISENSNNLGSYQISKGDCIN